MADGDLTATLEQIKADHEAANAFGANASDPAPRLLAAVEAALKAHAPDRADSQWCGGCGFAYPCETVRAITREITRKEESDADPQ